MKLRNGWCKNGYLLNWKWLASKKWLPFVETWEIMEKSWEVGIDIHRLKRFESQKSHGWESMIDNLLLNATVKQLWCIMLKRSYLMIRGHEIMIYFFVHPRIKTWHSYGEWHEGMNQESLWESVKWHICL